MTEEALKLALEALEEAWYHVGTFQPTEKAIDLYDEARAAIKEALAQEKALQALHDENERLGLYKEAYAQQEPVKLVSYNCKCGRTMNFESVHGVVAPQRKPLTDDEIYSVLENLQVMYNRPPTTDSRIIFARAIEAAHGIKGES